MFFLKDLVFTALMKVGYNMLHLICDPESSSTTIPGCRENLEKWTK